MPGSWLAWVASASAGGDGLGPAPAPYDAALDAPVAAPRLSEGVTLSFGAEYLRHPVVRLVDDGEAVVKEVLLGDVVLARLGAGARLAPSVGVGLTAPIVLGSGGSVGAGGPIVGAVELSALWSPWRATGGWFGVAPFVVVPTGKAVRWVRDHTPGAGVVAVGGLSTGPVGVTASAGVEYRDVEGDPTLSSGAAVRASLDGTVRLSRRVAAVAVARGRGAPGGRWPIEGGLGLRFAASDRWFGEIVASTGLRSGPGAPAARIAASVRYRLGATATTTTPDPGPPPPVLRVVDALGTPLPLAEVRSGDVVILADLRGEVPLDTLRGDGWIAHRAGYVSHPVRLEDRRVDTVVSLDWAPVPVRFEVVDPTGAPLAGTVRIDDRAVRFGDGSATFDVEPGEWTVAVESPGYAGQTRTLWVVPGTADPIEARILLSPAADDPAGALVVRLTDASGAPAAGVEVRVDGVAYGTTGSGGELSLDGLPIGSRRLELRSDRFQAFDLPDLVLGAEGLRLDLDLARQPGGVRLVVRSPDGPVPDAVARLTGPARLPATPLGSDGERIFQLRPGLWTIVVTSATWGVQSVDVTLEEGRRALADVEVFLQRPEGGAADLTVVAVDPDGRSLTGVAVSLDGQQVGTTASGGRFTVSGLVPGDRRLVAEGPHYRRAQLDVFLTDGPQEIPVVVEWQRGAIEVAARGSAGAVPDGIARFGGGRPVRPLNLDEDGRGLTALDPGAWAVVVTSPSRGVGEAGVAVPEDAGRLTVADVVFPDLERGDADVRFTVVDPEGRPVPDARVSFGGAEVGGTGPDGVFTLDDVVAGAVTARISHPWFVAQERALTLRDGANEARFDVAWAAGAVRVVAERDGRPQDDVVVRFSGPSAFPTTRLGPEGSRILKLEPGTWQGVATSPQAGLAEAVVEIDGAPRGLRTVRFTFGEPSRDTAELLVRVVDPRGAPLVGATVEVGDLPPRETGAGGLVLFRDLPLGTVHVGLNADKHFPKELFDVALRAGAQERVLVLEPVPGTVHVSVRSADGAPLSGEIRLLGPEDVDPAAIVDGTATLKVPPGSWRVLAVSPGYGTGSATLDLPPGDYEYDVSLVLEPARIEVTPEGILIGEAVLFDVGESDLRAEAERVLDEMAAFLLADATMLRLEVQGHTDSTGSASTNLALSERRAQAVADALLARLVPPERLVVKGYGPTRPVASNDTEEGRGRNRRVQLVVRRE